MRTVRQLLRALVPLDEKINGPFGPFPVRHYSEIPLVGIDMSDDESSTLNENSIIGKLLDHEDYYPEDTTPEEVSHTSFLIKSNAFGNLSGDEDNFDKDKTWTQVKIESVNPSDVSDSEAENPPENSQEEEEVENHGPQNGDDTDMDPKNKEPPSNFDDKREDPPIGQEVAQDTNPSTTFLTQCESGRIEEATWVSSPPTSRVYEENQEALKILREEQQNPQDPVPSTSSGARGLAVNAEMSNQDIKASIEPDQDSPMG